MYLDKQQTVIDLDSIICEQPIQKIEQLSIDALNQYAQSFRQSLIHIERGVTFDIYQQQDVKVFHQNIFNLIGKIQPSKTTLSLVLHNVEEILKNYYGTKQKMEVRKAVRTKKIFNGDCLVAAEEKEMFMEITSSIDQIKRCLMLRESQLGMVIYIQENTKKYTSEQFVKMYETFFKQIKQYIIPSEKCFLPINYHLLSHILQIQSLYYEQFGNQTTTLKDDVVVCLRLLKDQQVMTQKSKLLLQKNIKKLKILSSKVSTIADLFPFACTKCHDDLFSKTKTDNRWKKLMQSETITYKIYAEAEKVRKSFDKLKANLNVINAAMNIISQTVHFSGIKGIKNKLESARKILKVALCKENACHEAEVLISNPSDKLAKEIWNLPQRAQLRRFIELTLPSIQFSTQLFIPRVAQDYFQGMLKYEYGHLPNFAIKNISQYYNDLRIQKQSKVSIRINNYFKLLKRFKVQKQQKEQNVFFQAFTGVSQKIKNGVRDIKNNIKKAIYQKPKEVIFHIHGGGFISMSSFIHQIYTRGWANNLKVPIVSVDYGKAPEHPYPQGLADCLQAYLWTMHCMKQIYEFQPQKIILVGDSAGGNLVAALTNLLIKWNLRKPDGIVMVYPALNLSYPHYSPSLLTALDDMILPHTFLKICVNSYLKDKNYKPDTDCLVSPILTPVQILKRYPKTRMFVGSKDPFHDDCCRFAQKLSLVDPQRVRLMVVEQFPHGFLQFDMKHEPHEYCKQATKEVEQSLKQLIGTSIIS